MEARGSTMMPPVGRSGPGTKLDQLVGGRLREFDEMQRRVAKLAGIVGRDGRRHADSDAGRAVGEQVGEVGGEDARLLLAPVIIGAEVDRVLLDAVEELRRDLGQSRLGVAVGGGVVAVDITEIPLPVDQRIADGEVLGEARERVVDGLIAVRVEVAHRVADDLGAFAELAHRLEPELAHGVEHPAMHGLQPVAHVRECAVHDGRERVGEVTLLQRLAQVHRLDRPGRIRRRCAFSHASRLAHRVSLLKRRPPLLMLRSRRRRRLEA